MTQPFFQQLYNKPYVKCGKIFAFYSITKKLVQNVAINRIFFTLMSWLVAVSLDSLDPCCPYQAQLSLN